MSEASKITSQHRQRAAFVYVRQSSASQVEHNRESTARQYRLVDQAVELGWNRQQVQVVDEDLGISGAGLAQRLGFAHLTAQLCSVRSESSWDWRSRGWLATTPSGIVCSISAASPTRLSATPMGYTILGCSMIGWSWV